MLELERCSSPQIYGFSRLFPGRQFKDASGQISDASVWAHPTLHRLSSPGEIASVKRRAAPKLFRTRRLANGQVVRSRAGPGVEAKFREVREEIAESKRSRLSISSPPMTNGVGALTPLSSSLGAASASYTDRGASASPPPCPQSQSGFASHQAMQSPQRQDGQGMGSHADHEQREENGQTRPFWFPASPPLNHGQAAEYQQAQRQALTPHQPRATPFGTLTINTSGLSAFPRYRQSSLQSHSTQPALESITEQSELDSSPLYPGVGEAMEIDQAFAPISFTSVPLIPPNFSFIPHIIPPHGSDRGDGGVYGPPSWPGSGDDVDMGDRSLSAADPSPATPAPLGPAHPNTIVSCPASVHTSPLMTSANVHTAWARLFGDQSNPAAATSLPPTPVSAMLQHQQSQARKPLLEVAVPNHSNLSTQTVNTPHSQQVSPTDAIMPYGHSFSVFGTGAGAGATGQQAAQAFSRALSDTQDEAHAQAQAQAQAQRDAQECSRLQSPVFQDLRHRLSLAEQGNMIMTPATSTDMLSPPPTADHSAPMTQISMTPAQLLARASDPGHTAHPQIYSVEDQANGAPASLPHSVVDAEMPMSPTMRRGSYKLASSWEQDTIDPRWVSPVSSQWATPAITRAPSPSGGLHAAATGTPNPPPLIHSHSFPLAHVDLVNGTTGSVDDDGAFGMSFASWRAGLTVPQTHPPLGGVPMLDLGMGLGTQSYPPLARAGTELARRVTVSPGISAVKE